ncbi:hypothetical protein T484DRAFT_3467897 [Baffinella frigidus]|nr:hypothetical protein T484DRAFT_3467897 [Cryptophyta sp. CCMP2293]
MVGGVAGLVRARRWVVAVWGLGFGVWGLGCGASLHINSPPSGKLTLPPLHPVNRTLVRIGFSWGGPPLSSERIPLRLEFKVKFRLDSRAIDKILV